MSEGAPPGSPGRRPKLVSHRLASVARGAAGGPLLVENPQAPLPSEAELAALIAGRQMPLVQAPQAGKSGEPAGQPATVEVTFVAQCPSDREVLVHANCLTDDIRTCLDDAIMRPLPGTTFQSVTWRVAADAVFGYTFFSDDHIPRDLGRRREDWVRVHQQGQADPGNARQMMGGRGEPMSVFRGPDAPPNSFAVALDHATDAGIGVREWQVDSQDARLWVLPPERGAADAGDVLIVFDGHGWRAADLAAALAGAGRGCAVVAIDTDIGLGSNPEAGQRRAELLCSRDEVAHLVDLACAAVGRVGSTSRTGSHERQTGEPQRVIIAGQSLGGLACMLLATGQNLGRTQHANAWPHAEVSAVIALSPSLWHESATGIGAPRIATVILSGTEEGEICDSTRAYLDRLEASGWAESDEPGWVDHHEVRAGHDPAWWQDGLLRGLEVAAPITPSVT